MSRAEMPVATQALSSRAPSMWVTSPCAFDDARDFVERGLRPDRAAADIGGLLDADQLLRWRVAADDAKCRAQAVDGELAVVALQGCDLEAAESCVDAAFAGQDMRGLVRENFVRRPAMAEDAGDIAHGAGRQKHRRLLAEQIGDPFAQQVHRRVVAHLFVADLGAGDRLAHGRRRLGLRIRVHVDTDGWERLVRRNRCVGHATFLAVIGCRANGEGALTTSHKRQYKKGPGLCRGLCRTFERRGSARIEFDDQVRFHLTG